jgi:hypothetical protein
LLSCAGSLSDRSSPSVAGSSGNGHSGYAGAAAIAAASGGGGGGDGGGDIDDGGGGDYGYLGEDLYAPQAAGAADGEGVVVNGGGGGGGGGGGAAAELGGKGCGEAAATSAMRRAASALANMALIPATAATLEADELSLMLEPLMLRGLEPVSTRDGRYKTLAAAHTGLRAAFKPVLTATPQLRASFRTKVVAAGMRAETYDAIFALASVVAPKTLASTNTAQALWHAFFELI